jgi:hypothetical protein
MSNKTILQTPAPMLYHTVGEILIKTIETAIHLDTSSQTHLRDKISDTQKDIMNKEQPDKMP